MPLKNTRIDLWRLVYDHNACGIVVLGEIKSTDCYWPDAVDKSEIWGPLEIKCTSKNTTPHPHLGIQEFEVSNNLSPRDSQLIRQWHIDDWEPSPDTFTNRWRTLVDIMKMITEWQTIGNHDGPIIVQCPNGVDCSGMFIGLCCVLEKLQIDRQVDVAFVMQMLRQSRKHIIRNYVQYKILHDIACNVIESDV